MLFNILKPFLLFIFSFFVFYFYYFEFRHFGSFNFTYLYYFVIVGVVLAIYNFYLILIEQKKIKLSIFYPLGFFIFSLFVLCCQFFSSKNLIFLDSFTLFFKIIGYSFIPIFVLFITTSFGKKITKYLPKIESFSRVFRSILSLNLGFISFITLLILGSFVGLYNIYFVTSLLFIFAGISLKEMVENIKGLYNYKFEIDIQEGWYFKFFSSQFLFTIFSLVLGVALISIFRPFPIGWDDLGVYMNYPKQLVESGTMVSFFSMYSWQFFTGIGYMFGAPTFAFFFNISGTFITFIVLYFVLSDVLKKYVMKQGEKSFVSLPLMLSTFFISLPMVVFQTSKDMKLDIGLFFISISAIYLLFSYILNTKNGPTSPQPSSLKGEGVAKTESGNLTYLFIIGIIVGFAFSVKVTSLLLIISLLAILFYVRLGLLGFFAFFSLFLGIFTYLDLWKMMNVLVNPQNIPHLDAYIGIGFLVFGVVLLLIKFFIGTKNNLDFVEKLEKNTPLNLPLLKGKIGQEKGEEIPGAEKPILLVKEVGIFLLGIIIILLPWFGKNMYQTYPNISISGILNGKTDAYDFQKYLRNIYTETEIQKIEEYWKEKRKKENKLTTNDDLNRYIGHENGVLNYVNLPWNLTMQTNQGGEFTDISFLFFALIPLIFIFLPFRNKYFFLFFVTFLFLYTFFILHPKYKLIDNKELEHIGKVEKQMFFKKELRMFKKSIVARNIYNINFFHYKSKKDFFEEIVGNKEFIEELKKNLENRFNREQQKLFEQELNKPKNKDLKIAISAGKLSPDLQQKHQQIINEVKVRFESNKASITRQETIKLKYHFLERVKNTFYADLGNKVIHPKLDAHLKVFRETKLHTSDFQFIQKLHDIYHNYSIFSLGDVTALDMAIFDAVCNHSFLDTKNINISHLCEAGFDASNTQLFQLLSRHNISTKKVEHIKSLWSGSRTINGKIADILSKIAMPYSYVFILFGFLVGFLYLIFTLGKTPKNQLFTINIAFAFPYVFLWTISAFGIVWYGISMYFSFLLMIAFSAYYFLYYEKDDVDLYLKIASSLVLLLIFASYFIFSVIPHSFSNLKTAGYTDYKNGKIQHPSSTFAYHKDYINILLALNIKKEELTNFIYNSLHSDVKNIKNTYKSNKKLTPFIDFIASLQNKDKDLEKYIPSFVSYMEKLKGELKTSKDIKDKNLKNSLDTTLNTIYYGIINPEEKYRNTSYIYRVGTFLKYYISDNNKRLLEGSLLYNFNDYIAHKYIYEGEKIIDHKEETQAEKIDKLKKLEIQYIVLDLHAATIDKSKTHNLTKRYEKMLRTLTSDKLKLISTDSICLMSGLEYYKKTKSMEKYMNIVGVNYESYDENDRVIPRGKKLQYCKKFISDLGTSNSIDANNYSFLQKYKNGKNINTITAGKYVVLEVR